jgi:hypothetical protein
LNKKDLEIPVRIVIKWADFKPMPAVPTAAPPAAQPVPVKP